MRRTLLMWILLLFSLSATAHTPSSSFLFINEADKQTTIRWDIAIRDLEYVLGIDENRDQKITWAELKNKQDEISAYALSNLVLQKNNKSCRLNSSVLQVVDHTDGNYAVLNLLPDCEDNSGLLSIKYSLLFAEDANHRGVILDQRGGVTESYIASPETKMINLSDRKSGLRNFITFIKQGIWHILMGFDHILFVITLMLPAVLLYRNKKWQGVDKLKPAIVSLLKVVTAFTVAHSITLSLATLGIISLPTKWVESAIALSVIIVAVNNIKPIFTHARWSIAFLFGLIHGFGFASVLGDLNLNNGSLVLSLLGFNVGVEIGQGLILLLIFPLAYSVRKTKVYQGAILKGGSLAISLLASFWLVQRLGY